MAEPARRPAGDARTPPAIAAPPPDESWLLARLDAVPGCVPSLLRLASLRLARGDGAGAQMPLLQACGRAPHRAEIWAALGLSLVVTDDPAAAAAALARAQSLAPDRLDLARLRAESAVAAASAGGAPIEGEIAWLDARLGGDPLDAAALFMRATVLSLTGTFDQALDVAEAASALAPDAAEIAALLGRLLARTLRASEAEAQIAHACALAPDDVELANDHAVALVRVHRYADARAVLTRLIERHGVDEVRACNLANTLLALGEQAEAEAWARRAVAAAPDSPRGHRALVNAMLYRPGIGGAELLAALRATAARLPRLAIAAPLAQAPACGRDPARPLRVGLLSGTMKSHPVGWLTVAGLEALDPAGFALVGFAEHTADDALGRRFRAIAPEWHPTAGLDDAALVALARRRGIDIMLDLGGYGDHARMAALAVRAAPVQIKWVGAQGHSTGLPEMDWFLTDRWETPDRLAPLYSERLLCLPDGYVCYAPPPVAPAVAPLPALHSGHVTFGCFTNLAKTHPGLLRLWASLLDRVPGARLLLRAQALDDAGTAAAFGARAAACGVDPARLLLRGGARHRDFLDAYREVDIALDPFPYSGGLTTCEALFMGVPVVTWPGETFAGRHALSHLSNVGLIDWVAGDADEYVALAARRAADLPALAALRAELRARLLASPLCDAPRFGRALGAALRHAWSRHCAETPS